MKKKLTMSKSGFPGTKSGFSGTTIKLEKHQEKYVKFTMVLLAVAISVVVIFAVVIGVSAYTIVQTTTPAVRSLTSGRLNNAIQEAHLALKSARHVTDNLPVKDIVKHWEASNKLLQSTNIPWKELPHWRQLAQHSFRITTNMLKEHPEWARELKESTLNLKKSTQPLANESKEWRKSFKGAFSAYAKTLKNLYN
jgi:hypothetical protein